MQDTPWCNGNTAPFGGVILGSNPSGVARPGGMVGSGGSLQGDDRRCRRTMYGKLKWSFANAEKPAYISCPLL